MILNNADDGYESPAVPSPRAPEASTRWSVDEMRSAVAIRSDFQPPDYNTSALKTHALRRGNHHDSHHVSATTAPVKQEPPGFSGLDLLFQADAMIQKRTSPERRAPSAATNKTKKPIKKTRPPPLHNNDLNNDDDDDQDMGTTTIITMNASSPKYLRSGVWTRAEEEYAAALIFYFLRGALPIAEGTTLRKYLAEQLCCNRRRVSMKLATETIADKKIPRKVGASVFVALKPSPTDESHRQVVEVLENLRQECFREGEQQPRQGGSTMQADVSPLVLGEHGKAPTDLSLSTPARRKQARPSPSPKKRRPSISSNPKTSPPQIKRRRPLIIRTGFDSDEEEQYVVALVEYFTAGTLDLAENTRLVTYLGEQLDCSPKTLSMKLAPRKMGEQKFPEHIGSITFSRKEDDDVSSEIFEAEAHVFELRQNWLQSVEDGGDNQQQQQHDEGDEDTASETASQVSTPSQKIKVEASVAVSGSKSPSNNPPPSYTRSGPWSRHEEEYAAGLIDAFFRGVLDIAEGTTLRAFLTSRLKCNPMRISKKLASHTIADVKIPKKLGSATYVRRDGVSESERQAAEEHLHRLETVSRSQQTIRESIVMGVIGTKHSRDDDAACAGEVTPHRQFANPSARSPTSPFKVRRMVVDEYPQDDHRRSPREYDYYDARYQSVAY